MKYLSVARRYNSASGGSLRARRCVQPFYPILAPLYTPLPTQGCVRFMRLPVATGGATPKPAFLPCRLPVWLREGPPEVGSDRGGGGAGSGAGAERRAGRCGAERGPGLPALFSAPPLGVSLYHFSSSSNLEWKRVIREKAGFSAVLASRASRSQKRLTLSPPPLHPHTPLLPPQHTHTHTHPLGAPSRLRDHPPDIERKGFVWRAISDRGRSIGLVGLSACRRREK